MGHSAQAGRKMSRILLFLEHTENRRLLSAWLSMRYEVLLSNSEVQSGHAVPLLDTAFDLCIIDGPNLDNLWEWVRARKKVEQPVFLPFLLITLRPDVKLITRHLWQSVDELVTKPIEKMELQARVEILLRSRQLSLELKTANELKSDFVSTVSHEFRNPLNVISVSAQLLERFSDQWSQEKQSEFLQRIQTASIKMVKMLDDILLIGKADVGKQNFNPALHNLTIFCSELAAEIQLGNSNAHTIIFVCCEEYTNTYVDENLLRRILSNLLSNAIKYSPQGSTVHFELTFQAGEVSFQIKDEGIGIPLEDQKRMFESFHRATNVGNIPGTGLGLAIVKQSVDLHGGKIALASEVGVGTTFTVTLPCYKEADIRSPLMGCGGDC